MRLTFLKLKEVAEIIDTNQNQKLCDFFNEFEGDNVYQKFKTILKFWEYHVNDTLTFNPNGKQLNLQISYLLNELSDEIESGLYFENDDFNCELQLANTFVYDGGNMPIYNLIKNINISNVSLNLSDLSFYDKKMVIDKLPAKIFSNLIDILSKDKTKIFKLENKALENIKLNFYTNDPFLFLKSLFGNYSKEYFQDVIFFISKRISADILMNSDVKDVNFYIKKYSDEIESQQKNLPSLDF
jgi:hypothetical protein